ncbi:glycosyltransferase [Paenisporosarcina sp. OV554]|uniref:glycosyltransferase n=1 Tax=Paenisporosarcina sp. OV554 TaxID=2135694 RepID=UPI000D3AEC39|nr:glycosyltransferase [Paenisporosarcina sp. OV554]PUB10189.1 glycosyltransferase involved in cell wall biosynthesis [Paenisporosarcina sp. OV554]
MSILILTQDYPSSENKYAMPYVHSRSRVYSDKNIKFEVLNFSSKKSYVYENINILNYKDAINKIKKGDYNLIISHAPNIKNHIKFLMKYRRYYKGMLMFFHGHEALRVDKYYPMPYSYRKNRKMIQKLYDVFKLFFLHQFIKKSLKLKNIHLVFVSEWMKEHFIKNVNLNQDLITHNSSIINNNSNEIFNNNSYELNTTNILADFITIRPLDDSKYAIDIVVEFAKDYPKYKFHIYGKGRYFDYHDMPENIEVFSEFFTQDELPNLFDKYRFALMPTRLDSQGVMMCEMATYGIPLITSDIPICREMLRDFNNVQYISNENLAENIKLNLKGIEKSIVKNSKFNVSNTVKLEIDIINNTLSKFV